MQWMLSEPETLISRAGVHLHNTGSDSDELAYALEDTPIDPALWDYFMSELQGQGSSSARPNHRDQSSASNLDGIPVASAGAAERNSDGRPRRTQSRAHSPDADQSVEDQWRTHRHDSITCLLG